MFGGLLKSGGHGRVWVVPSWGLGTLRHGIYFKSALNKWYYSSYDQKSLLQGFLYHKPKWPFHKASSCWWTLSSIGEEDAKKNTCTRGYNGHYIELELLELQLPAGYLGLIMSLRQEGKKVTVLAETWILIILECGQKTGTKRSVSGDLRGPILCVFDWLCFGNSLFWKSNLHILNIHIPSSVFIKCYYFTIFPHLSTDDRWYVDKDNFFSVIWKWQTSLLP